MRVSFDADVARFTSSVDKITNDLSKFQSHSARISRNVNSLLGSIGVGLSAAGIVAFSKSIIDGLDKLNDLSKTTGLAVNTLSGLGVAAKQSGTDLDGVAASISKLSVNIGKNSEKFRELGITAKDPLEAFKQLADVFVAIKDPQERAAVAAAALGKSWQSAAPLLSEGGAAIGRMVSEGEKATGVTKEMTEQADKFNDELELMKAKLSGVTVTLLGDSIPNINKFIAVLSDGAKQIKSFFSAPTEDTKIGDRLTEIGNLTSSALKVQKLFNVIGLTPPDSASNSYINKLNEEALTLKRRLEDVRKAQSDVSSGKPADPIKPPSSGAIKRFLGDTEGASAAKALAARQKTFIENLQKEASNLGATSIQLKLYEAAILKITGAKLDSVKADATKIESYKLEQDALESMRNSYADSADAYLSFIQQTQADTQATDDKLGRMKLEIGLADKTEAQRNKAIAQYDLEIKYKERLKSLSGLDTGDNIRMIQEESLAKAKAGEEEVVRFQEQIDTQKKAAGEMQKVWDNFGFNFQRNVGDQIYRALNGDFENIGAAWKSMLTRMLSDALAAKLSSAIFGEKGVSDGLLKGGLSALGSLFGGFGGGSKTPGMPKMAKLWAKGGAFESGKVIPFAMGGIVSSPTPFKFSEGGSFRNGLMGEAGPEAIMPLKRGADGKLGVSGGGGRVVVNNNQVINVDSRSDRASVMQDIRRMIQQGNAELVDRLSRQGAI